MGGKDFLSPSVARHNKQTAFDGLHLQSESCFTHAIAVCNWGYGPSQRLHWRLQLQLQLNVCIIYCKVISTANEFRSEWLQCGCIGLQWRLYLSVMREYHSQHCLNTFGFSFCWERLGKDWVASTLCDRLLYKHCHRDQRLIVQDDNKYNSPILFRKEETFASWGLYKGHPAGQSLDKDPFTGQCVSLEELLWHKLLQI